MNAPLKSGSLAEQVAKLLPMLAGNHDGEVLAAARAIDRKLRAGGKDWHWLAGKVAEPEFDWAATIRAAHASTRQPEPKEEPTKPYEPPPPPKPKWATMTRFTKLMWLGLLKEQPDLKPYEFALCAELQAALHRGQPFEMHPYAARMFNRLVATLIKQGVRYEFS